MGSAIEGKGVAKRNLSCNGMVLRMEHWTQNGTLDPIKLGRFNCPEMVDWRGFKCLVIVGHTFTSEWNEATRNITELALPMSEMGLSTSDNTKSTSNKKRAYPSPITRSPPPTKRSPPIRYITMHTVFIRRFCTCCVSSIAENTHKLFLQIN